MAFTPTAASRDRCAAEQRNYEVEGSALSASSATLRPSAARCGDGKWRSGAWTAPSPLTWPQEFRSKARRDVGCHGVAFAPDNQAVTGGSMADQPDSTPAKGSAGGADEVCQCHRGFA